MGKSNARKKALEEENKKAWHCAMGAISL